MQNEAFSQGLIDRALEFRGRPPIHPGELRLELNSESKTSAGRRDLLLPRLLSGQVELKAVEVAS